MRLMTFTGSTVNFGIAAVFGVILGSFNYVLTKDTAMAGGCFHTRTEAAISRRIMPEATVGSMSS